MNLEGKIDFIIRNVNKKDVIGALKDESKKYFVFADENSFQDEKYDIFGEVTINLFQPSVYLQKLKQIIRYILLIKLIEKHPEYFKSLNIPSKKKVIMVVTDGNYTDFIDKLSNSKIFSKDFEEKEFISNSIDKIINYNKFKEEIDDYQNKIDNLKKLKEDSYKKIEDFVKKNNLIAIKKNYSGLKNENFNLKSRTINLLKILKSSNIPFILCYFPKIGGEFNYELFKGKAIFLEKAKTKFNYYQYKFIVNDNEQYIKRSEINKIMYLKRILIIW